MAISRYRRVQALQDKFAFKLDKKTKKKINLTFYDKVTMQTISNTAFGDMQIEEVTFKATDTLMGLAQRYYESPSYWWVIALINNVGSETDIELGQTLVILKPLEVLLPELGL